MGLASQSSREYEKALIAALREGGEPHVSQTCNILLNSHFDDRATLFRNFILAKILKT